MEEDLWISVDRYIINKLIPREEVLEQALSDNAAAGLPAIEVSPLLGKLLYTFASMQHAQRILEIGTLGGYSTIWLARALPRGGKLITLELDPRHAEIASANIKRAGLSSLVELRLGPALESLQRLGDEYTPPFDLIFIDADKQNNPAYLDWGLRFSRPGTVIVCDNVVRKGAIVDPANKDEAIEGIRRFFEKIEADPRLDATALQTVGIKGYDGFALIRVLEGAESHSSLLKAS